jgi:hypothetical protein
VAVGVAVIMVAAVITAAPKSEAHRAVG